MYETDLFPHDESGEINLGFTDPHFALSSDLEGIIDTRITYGNETVRFLDISPDISPDALERINRLKQAELLVSVDEEEEARYEELANIFGDGRPLNVVVIPAGAKQLYGERLFEEAEQNSSTHVNDDEIFRLCGQLWRKVYETVGEVPTGGLLRRTAMSAHDFDVHGLKIIPESSDWESIRDFEKVASHLSKILVEEMGETISSNEKIRYFVEIFLNGFRGI